MEALASTTLDCTSKFESDLNIAFEALAQELLAELLAEALSSTTFDCI